MKKCLDTEFDVALSFAGEDRKYVEETASFLKKQGVKVFYDKYEEINLWGKDLYQHLDDIYQNKSKFTVVFISENYRKKLWTAHELRSAQARAFVENEEYILPVRFDDTEIPGIRKTVGYLSLESIKPEELANKIASKLDYIEPTEFLPDELTFVREVLSEIYESFPDEEVDEIVNYVFGVLCKTNRKEREFLASFVLDSCWHDITEDLHHSMNYVQRITGFERDEIISILNNLSELGFEYKLVQTESGTKEHGNLHNYEQLCLQLLSLVPSLPMVNLTPFVPILYVAAISGRCSDCAWESMMRLDFSDLKNSIEEEELIPLLPFIDEEE